MRSFILLVVVMYINAAQAQTDSTLGRLQRAVKLHDAGEYDAAISIYDEVIRRDSANLLAWYEKSYSLYASKRYLACADLCNAVLKRFSKGDELDNIYVNYGVSLDALKQTSDAITIYSEGISRFPENHLLFFNRAIAYDKLQMPELAIKDVQQSLTLQPLHAASHLLLGNMLRSTHRIAAALSLGTYLLLEPFATKNTAAYWQFIAMAGIPLSSSDSQTRYPFKQQQTDTALDAALKETLLTIMQYSVEEAAPAIADSSLHVTIKRRIELFASIDANRHPNFFTRYYGYFFKGLLQEDFTEAAVHIIAATGGNVNAKAWMAANADQILAFSRWLREYRWH